VLRLTRSVPTPGEAQQAMVRRVVMTRWSWRCIPWPLRWRQIMA
jgi:hypothetical protein